VDKKRSPSRFGALVQGPIPPMLLLFGIAMWMNRSKPLGSRLVRWTPARDGGKNKGISF